MDSQAPKVGIEEFEDPQATSSMSPSISRIALPVSLASRPYSSAVLWPTCHGPSISLPRHHSFTPNGSVAPLAMRRSDQYVPPEWLVYSSRSQASCRPRVPRLTAIIGSVRTLSAQDMKSCSPNWLVSIECQARSRRVGRWSRGPTPSSHR